MHAMENVPKESGIIVFKDGWADQELTEAFDSALAEAMSQIYSPYQEQMPSLILKVFTSAIKALYDSGLTIGDQADISIATFEEVAIVMSQTKTDGTHGETTVFVKRMSHLN